MGGAVGGGTIPLGGIIDVGRVVGTGCPLVRRVSTTGGGATVMQQNPITGAFRRRQITLPAPRVAAPRRPSEVKWIMMPVQNFIQCSESSSEDNSVNQDNSQDEGDGAPARRRSKGGQTESRSTGSTSSSSSYESLNNYPHVQESGHSHARLGRMLLAEELQEAQWRQMNHRRPRTQSPPEHDFENRYASGLLSCTPSPETKSQASRESLSPRLCHGYPSDSSSPDEASSSTNSSKISSLSTSGSECRTGSATSERVARAVERIMGGNGPKAIKLTSTVIKILPEMGVRRPEPVPHTMEPLDEDAKPPPPPLPESRQVQADPEKGHLDERDKLQAKLHSVFQSRREAPVKTAAGTPKRPPKHPSQPAQSQGSKSSNQVVTSHLTARLKEATTATQSRIRVKSSPKEAPPTRKTSIYLLMNHMKNPQITRTNIHPKDPGPKDTRKNQMKILAKNHSLVNVPKNPVKKARNPQGHPGNLGNERTLVKGPAPKPPVPVSLNRIQRPTTAQQQRLPTSGGTQPAPQRRPLNEILGAGGKIVQMSQHKVPKTMEDGVDMSYQYFVSIPLKRGRKPQVVRYLYRPMVRNLNGPPAPTKRSLRRAKRKAEAEAAAAAAAAAEAATAAAAEQGSQEASVESMAADPDLVALGGVPVLLEEPAKELPNEKPRRCLDPEAVLNAPYEEPPLKLEAKYMPMLEKLAQMPYPEERHGRRRKRRRARVAGGSEQVAQPTSPFGDGGYPEQLPAQYRHLGGICRACDTARGAGGVRTAAGNSVFEGRRGLSSLWPRAQIRPEMRSSLINYRPHPTRLNTVIGIPISYHTPVFLGQARADCGTGSSTGSFVLPACGDAVEPEEPMIRAVTYEDVQQEELAESSDPHRRSGSNVRKSVSFRPEHELSASPSAGCAASGTPSSGSGSGTSISISSLSSGFLAAGGQGGRGKVKGRRASRKSKAKAKGKSKPRGKNRR